MFGDDHGFALDTDFTETIKTARGTALSRRLGITLSASRLATGKAIESGVLLTPENRR
jgi:hypothetical protein